MVQLLSDENPAEACKRVVTDNEGAWAGAECEFSGLSITRRPQAPDLLSRGVRSSGFRQSRPAGLYRVAKRRRPYLPGRKVCFCWRRTWEEPMTLANGCGVG